MFSTSAHAQTSTTQASIFPLLASNNLREALGPTANHISLFLLDNFPNKLTYYVHQFSDEIFTLFDGLVSTFYLKNFGGLFTEHFYGIQRTSPNVKKVLFMQIVIPYLKLKLDRFIDNTEDPQRLKIAKSVRALIHFLYVGFDLVLTLLYIGGFSRHHSWLNYADNSELKHISKEDAEVHEEKIESWPSALRVIHQLVVNGLSFSAFILQFIDHWFSEQASNRSVITKSTPQAPKTSEKSNKCPLCRTDRIQTPTLLTICGYVFCYRCIHQHLVEEKKCPVTQLPADSTQLIRLF